MAAVVEAAAPVEAQIPVVVAGTHQEVAEVHTPDSHMIQGTVDCWHHEAVLADLEVAKAVLADLEVAWAPAGDVLLLWFWTLSLMCLHQGLPHFRLQGHHKA